VRIEWVTDEAAFAEIAEPWSELAGEGALPYLRHRWFEAWARAFAAPGTVETPVAWEGERMVACLPAVRERRDLRAMANWETPLYSPIAAAPADAEAVLREAVERSARMLVLDGIEAGGDGERAVEAMARLARYGMLARHWQTSPVIETTGSFEEYRERTRPGWLKRLARYRRKMDREMGLQLAVAELPASAGSAFDECLRLEAAGWKGRSGTAIASSPATEGFYRDVFAMLLDSGELRLSLLRLNGRLAAFDLGFAFDDRIYSLKTAFDETLKQVVPGLVLRLSIVEHCFERGLQANELLGGDLPWKRNFATAARPHLTYRCYRSNAAGRGAHLADARLRPALGRMRRALRRVRRRSDG
jgi:CelD/BcsL family acetyltransferase involved in cellulose biosynthesis